MSFILDALRKSEHERQRQSGPGIAELPIARPASRAPVALIAVGALLAVNLLIVLVLLLRQSAPEAPAAAPSAGVAAPGSQLEAPPAADRPRPPASVAQARPTRVEARSPPVARREIRPLVEEAAPPSSAGPGFDPPPAPDPSLVPAAPAPVAVRQVQRGTVSAPPSSGEFVPRLETLPPHATAGLPALNLDLHIYATQPSQRSVFINGRRYVEGDSLPEGATVETITTDGAVLQYRGQRFLLPRQ